MFCRDSPGWCDGCGRRVRWADIQTCTQGNRMESPKSCIECVHASAPLKNAAGDVIGQKDCGCGGRATGRTWVTCSVTGNPVEVRKALRCESFRNAE